MAKKMPTQFGDVIVKSSDAAPRIYLVCTVFVDGQQDHGPAEPERFGSLLDAKERAGSIVVETGGRIFSEDLKSHEWKVEG